MHVPLLTEKQTIKYNKKNYSKHCLNSRLL